MHFKRAPTSEDGRSFWRRRSVSRGSNRKTEYSGCAVSRECWAVSGDRGFAPVPPGFSALSPHPLPASIDEIAPGCYVLQQVTDRAPAPQLKPTLLIFGRALRSARTSDPGSRWVSRTRQRLDTMSSGSIEHDVHREANAISARRWRHDQSPGLRGCRRKG